VKTVPDEIADLEQGEPAQDLAPSQRRDRPAELRANAFRLHRSRQRQLADDRDERHGRETERGEQQPPAAAERDGSGQEQRSGCDADGSRKCPPGHRLLMALGIEIHQRGLREPDEGARGRGEEEERDQQRRESACRRCD